MIYIIKSNNRLIPCRDMSFGIILKPKNRNNRFVFRQASTDPFYSFGVWSVVRQLFMCPI